MLFCRSSVLFVQRCPAVSSMHHQLARLHCLQGMQSCLVLPLRLNAVPPLGIAAWHRHCLLLTTSKWQTGALLSGVLAWSSA